MPKIVDHNRRRAEIAALTLEVIRTVGIENATIRGIGNRGGLSMGVLTHYFKKKDELLAFAFRWLSDRFFFDLDKLLATTPPGFGRLEVALEAVFPKPGEPAGIALWTSLWERAARNPAFAKEHRAYYTRWRRYVRTFLREAVALRQTPPRLRTNDATDLLVAAIDGLWISSALEPKRFSLARRRALVRQLVGTVTQRRRRGRDRTRPVHAPE
jgi:AcrR family transcriptional regulator